MIKKLLCTAVIVHSLANFAIAQTSDPATNAIIAGMYREYEQTKSAILAKFRNVLNNEERAVLDRLRFNIDRNSWNVSEVYADEGLVNISLGFLTHVNSINGAFAYETYNGVKQNKPPNTDRAIEFANYYVDALAAQGAALRLGRTVPAIKTYFQWAGMNPGEIAAIQAKLSGDAEYVRMHAMFSEINLAIVLGHELGHHVLRHVPVLAPLGPKEEAAADAFGFKVAVKAGYPALGAVGTFMMLDRFESRNRAAATAIHPPAYCRWFRAAVSGWSAIKDDEKLVAEYKRLGRSHEIDQMNGLLEKGERAVTVVCPVELCELITGYFSAAPKMFIAERGEPAGNGRWSLKSDLPNATCFIRERSASRGTTHLLRCNINSKSPESIVRDYYTNTAGYIDRCVRQLATLLPWKEESIDETDDDENITGRRWTSEKGTQTYEISIEVQRNLKRPEFRNWLTIEYVNQSSR